MIRKFSLKNSLNNTMTLTSKSFKVFLNSPQGLGYQSAVGVARYGDKAVATDEVFEFPTVSGQILFYDDENSDRYKKYNDFVAFLSYKPLELKYTLPTTTANEYTLECYATELTKTETGENDIMTCNITLQGLSFWRGSALTVTGSASSYQLTNSGHYPVGLRSLLPEAWKIHISRLSRTANCTAKRNSTIQMHLISCISIQMTVSRILN